MKKNTLLKYKIIVRVKYLKSYLKIDLFESDTRNRHFHKKKMQGNFKPKTEFIYKDFWS